MLKPAHHQLVAVADEFEDRVQDDKVVVARQDRFLGAHHVAAPSLQRRDVRHDVRTHFRAVRPDIANPEHAARRASTSKTIAAAESQMPSFPPRAERLNLGNI